MPTPPSAHRSPVEIVADDGGIPDRDFKEKIQGAFRQVGIEPEPQLG